MINKTCSKCGLIKILTEFYKDRSNKNGYRSDCKSCHIPIVRRYQSTERGKEIAKKSDKKRTGTPKRRISANNSNRKYKKTPKGRITNAKYINSPAGKLTKELGWRRRRERSKNLDCKLTKQDLIIIKHKFNYKCFNCNSSIKIHIDHHRPLSRGFGLSLQNAVLLCKTCNTKKNNKWPEQFYNTEKLKILSHILQ